MFQKAIIGIALNGLALYGVAYFLEEVTYTGGVAVFIAGGIILGILNLIVKPILRTAAIPIVFLTGGIFLIVINTFLLWVTKTALDIVNTREMAIQISGLTTYFIAGFLLGIINWFEHILIKNKS